MAAYSGKQGGHRNPGGTLPRYGNRTDSGSPRHRLRQPLAVFRKQGRLFVLKVIARKDDQRTAEHRKRDENDQEDDGEILFEQSGGLPFPLGN